MALSSVTLTELAITSSTPAKPGSRLIEFWATVAIGASPGTYATGGLTLSFAGIDGIKSNSLPLAVQIWSAHAAASPQTNAFYYLFAPGTTIANGTIQIYTGAAAQTALTELSAGSTPAGVSGDTIILHAWFPAFI